MSKAEERAQEAYPAWRNGIGDEFSSHSAYLGFIEGYHQAEKDLELTLEDMMLIHKCIKDAMNYHLYKMIEGVEGQKVVYKEILKRFKEQKGEET